MCNYPSNIGVLGLVDAPTSYILELNAPVWTSYIQIMTLIYQAQGLHYEETINRWTT